MANTQWIWDPTRQLYYYYNYEESCYVFQDGNRIHQTGSAAFPSDKKGKSSKQSTGHRETESKGSAQDPLSHRLDQLRIDKDPPAPNAAKRVSRAERLNRRSSADHTQHGHGSSSKSQNAVASRQSPNIAAAADRSYSVTPAHRFHFQTPISSAYQPPGHQLPDIEHGQQAQMDKQLSHTASEDPGGPSWERGEAEKITDPSLLRVGVQATMIIKGTAGKREMMDPRYQVQSQPKDFFVVGKVFKVLWPELPSTGDDAITVVSAGTRIGNFTAVKFRWFVVIKRGTRRCSCLPIQTYHGRGVGKPGVVKAHHAIIYTGKPAPTPLREEGPRQGEGGMLQPIRVKRASQHDRLDRMSRINFAKVYTIEHNVKVYDFGNVHRDFLRLLTDQFNYVWDIPGSGELSPGEDTPDEQDDKEEGKEDEEDDDDDDDDEEGEEEDWV